MAKVLIVDDSNVDRALAASLLHKGHGSGPGGMELTHAGNGQEALDAIERARPDLVITDLQMPGMNGLELVEAVKAKYPALPVILMTAHGSEEIAMLSLERGASSYVPKRKLATDLLETVGNVLAVAGAQKESRRLLDECWLQTESQFLLPNDLSHVPSLIVHLQDSLRRFKVCTENDLVRVSVALREALSNAIIHGNLEVGSELRETDEKAYFQSISERKSQEPYKNRLVHVVAEESRAEAVYVVRDEGLGFDVSNAPDPTDPANLENVSGRGLFLIHTFMDQVRFNATGNEITMVKRAGK